MVQTHYSTTYQQGTQHLPTQHTQNAAKASRLFIAAVARGDSQSAERHRAIGRVFTRLGQAYK